jgi:glycosyltransferase involved in cell wall biosynthesis/O-antigen/teichoic acid export membrane protein
MTRPARESAPRPPTVDQVATAATGQRPELARVSKAAASMTAASVGVGVGNLLFNVLVARRGGVAAYGSVGTLLALTTVAGFLSSGIQYAVARHSATTAAPMNELLHDALRSTLPWVAIAMTLIPFAPFISSYLHVASVTPYLLVVGLFVIMTVAAVPLGLLIGKRHFSLVAIVLAAGPCVRLAGVPLVGGGKTNVAISAMTASTVPMLAVCLGSIALVRHWQQPRQHESLRYASGERWPLTREGMGGAVFAAGLWLVWSMPLFLAQHSLDGSAAGSFASTYVVATGIVYVSGAFTPVVFPSAAAGGERKTVVFGFVCTGLIASAAAVGLTLLGPYLLPRLYGPGYRVHLSVLAGFGLSAVATSLATYALWIARAMRRPGSMIGAGLVTAVIAEAVAGQWLRASGDRLALMPAIALLCGGAAVGASWASTRRLRRGAIRGASPALESAHVSSILILNWKDPFQKDAGGAERYVHNIARIWASQGRKVVVFVPRPRGVSFSEERDGVVYVRRGTRNTVFWHARVFLRQHGHHFDQVVESVSTRPFRAHEIVGVHAMVLYHQVADDVWRQEYRWPVSWLGQRVVEPRWIRRMRSARVVAVSPSTAADLGRHGVTVANIAPPGCSGPITETSRQFRGDGGVRVVFVGRLVHSKRPQDAIRAFELLRATCPSAQMDVIGDGYLRRRLLEHAVSGVTVHGYVGEEEKHALLARADVLLLPGTREGWGIVALEAARHGVPVVAYRIPGLSDAVVHGETGLLTGARNGCPCAAA